MIVEWVCAKPILVVGALSLNVASLLALVADLLTTSGLLGAVTRVVARLAAVVALHAVNTFARHVAVATAGVAGLASTTAEAALTAAAIGVAEAGLGAVAGDVADFAALVALGRASHATTGGATHGAVARNVAGLTALVAGLILLHGLATVTAHVALVAAVVALGRTLGGAIAGLVTRVAARVAGTATGLRVIHCDGKGVKTFW